jgi:hypothetical protein
MFFELADSPPDGPGEGGVKLDRIVTIIRWLQYEGVKIDKIRLDCDGAFEIELTKED